VSLSNSTVAFFSDVFYGGNGPTHADIDVIWNINGASRYVPADQDAIKRTRVLYGLRWLRDGRAFNDPWLEDLPPDDAKLRAVAGELANKLIQDQYVERNRIAEVLERDGLLLDGDRLVDARPVDGPADEIAQEVVRLFGDRPALAVARNHYEQAQRAFDRGDYEAANSQFRSAYDATYDALAHAMGCPVDRTGGLARRWLQDNGHIDEDEADLMKTFAVFAGRAGSHAGLSDASDSQLRRHFATALIAFGVAKFGA
jgi:hypothetical protein